MATIKSPQPIFDTLSNLAISLPKHYQSIAISEADFRYAREFLYSYRGSAATFSAYRREIERLLLWSWIIAKKSISALKRADIERYVEFCQKPPLTWIGTNQVPRFLEQQGERIPNPIWRPFAASVSKVAHDRGELANPNKFVLSQKALQAVFAILGSFYNYLLQEDYVGLNPVAQIRQKSKFLRKQQANSQQIRRLSSIQWNALIATAEALAAQQPELHERTLFIMNVLYGMYLRISELVASERWQPQMGHFHKDNNGNWWFTTVGKGNKERIISVSDDILNALKRYRQHLNLTSLPAPGETTPLFTRQRGAGPITSTRQIRAIVQDCFDKTIVKLQSEHYIEEADQLRAATVHWLRHTGISDDVKHRPREHVRDDAGHSSSAITDKYIDIELRERHASAKYKKIKPESGI